MLADKSRHRRRGDDRAGTIGIDRRDAKWRVESAGRVDGHALETDKMRRTHEHGDIERAIAQQPIGMRGDWARIHQPGVRRDERHQLPRGLPIGAIRAGQLPIDGGRERIRRARVPAPRNGCLSDVARHGHQPSVFAC